MEAGALSPPRWDQTRTGVPQSRSRTSRRLVRYLFQF